MNQTLRERISRHESTATPGTALTDFFTDVVQRSLDDREQRGCLMVNSALEAAPGDLELRGAITEELTHLTEFFLRNIDAGQRSGELRPDLDARQAAHHLLAVLLGVRVIARIHPERDWLVGAVSPALTQLGLRPLSID
ncbi:TetR family transcriptional regulator C-terminal domain-containing protein [Pandoraea terrigena]|uniref:TetR family transcriptional regulator C-terminal domain-containing protein n=1 Tax=Pandoraea terrigena TaxID=2508292 RepID=UPI0031B5F434